jgi:hypothetical protein
MNESEMYSGVYARVSVNFFPYDNTGKKGIGCGLGNVQKLEDGEPLGNRTSAASDFGQPMAGAPMAGQPGGFTVSPNSGYISPAPPVQPSPAYPVGGVVPGQFNQPVQPGQPAYNAGQFVNPVQPVQPAQPVQVNPITGQPITPGGGILGL